MSAEAWAAWATLLFLLLGAVAGFVRAWYRQEQKVDKLAGDVKNLSMKMAGEIKDGQRRYHNVSLAIMLISPDARESEVCEFLKEGD